MTRTDFRIAVVLINIACAGAIIGSILGGAFVWWIDVIGIVSGVAAVNALFCILVHVSGIRSTSNG